VGGADAGAGGADAGAGGADAGAGGAVAGSGGHGIDGGVDGAGGSCAAGTHNCAGHCNPNASIGSCGQSCVACVSPAHAQPTCDGSSCGFVCNAGYFAQSGGCHVAATAIAVGELHVCALLASGAVWCWGHNVSGQVGNGTAGTQDVLLPQQVLGIENAIAISAGELHTCVTLSDGTVACWGLNNSGELGIPFSDFSATPATVTGLTAVKSLACGTSHTCAIVGGGSVECWGYNGNDALGNGGAFQTPGASATPLLVPGVSNAVAIAAGLANTCVALATGEVQCWGKSGDGELGSLVSSDSSIPITVAGINSPTALTIGEFHICGLLAGGAIKCWGYNADGELGIGLSGPTIMPTPVNVVGVTTATSISAGPLGTCATLADGSTRCWGFTDVGNGRVAIAQPVAVGGISGATKIGTTLDNGCAVRNDGSVVCWGSNAVGQQGNGTRTYAPTAMPVTALW
jgi:alpha-tubulin suppressor-like RCC1 family protein